MSKVREAIHAPNMNETVVRHAEDAVRELFDRRAKIADQTGNVQDRLITPAMAKEAIEERLRDVLPKGALLPRVRVGLNAMRTGFVIDIQPGEVPTDLRPGELVRKS